MDKQQRQEQRQWQYQRAARSLRVLRVLRVLGAVLASLALGAASPFVSEPVIDPLSRDISAPAYDTSLAIDGTHAWACYVRDDLSAVLADGELGSDPQTAWRYTVIDAAIADDSHNGCSVGIDSAGYIHIVYGMHNDPIRYLRSGVPGDPATLQTATMGGGQSTDNTYPRFHRAGSELYFFARSGFSGNGDVYLKRLNPSGQWEDVAYPLLTGGGDSSPYLGTVWVRGDGDLDIVWTHRIGFLNFGLYYAHYDAGSGQWLRSNGVPYSVPIARAQAEAIVSPLDATVSNTGMGIAVTDSGTLHAVYLRHHRGYREVFHARRPSAGSGAGSWLETQLSDLQAPRLRACPIGPDLAEPRPCDVEVSAPTLIAHGGESLSVLYSRAVAPSRGSFARPAGITFRVHTTDGINWIADPCGDEKVELLGSEAQPASDQSPYVLRQRAGNPYASSSPTSNILTVSEVSSPPSVLLSVDAANLPGAMTAKAPTPSGDWSIKVRIRPSTAAPLAPMSVIDRGGPSGSRQFRILIWGNNDGTGFRYDPNYIQVLLGNETGGWGLVAYVPAQVPRGAVSDIEASRTGTQIQIKLNGEALHTATYASSFAAMSNLVLIGASLSASGVQEYPFSGSIQVRIEQTAPTP